MYVAEKCKITKFSTIFASLNIKTAKQSMIFSMKPLFHLFWKLARTSFRQVINNCFVDKKIKKNLAKVTWFLFALQLPILHRIGILHCFLCLFLWILRLFWYVYCWFFVRYIISSLKLKKLCSKMSFLGGNFSDTHSFYFAKKCEIFFINCRFCKKSFFLDGKIVSFSCRKWIYLP